MKIIIHYIVVMALLYVECHPQNIATVAADICHSGHRFPINNIADLVRIKET